MRLALIAGLSALALMGLLLLPPISQDPLYHSFTDQRTFWGVPNFLNVVSNLPFLLVALWGFRAFRSPTSFLQSWERIAYGVLLAGVALVALGSSYYHLRPSDDTLFWDRLPMTIVFMSLLATTIGERVSPIGGRLLLLPLLMAGAAAVLYWRFSGDLRLYVAVQFFPMLALPLMILLLPARYSDTVGILAMIGFYAVAKILELLDHQIGAVLTTGGHPWKHVAGAVAMLCYTNTVARRRPLGVEQDLTLSPGRLVTTPTLSEDFDH
jgi:hypothetical protein